MRPLELVVHGFRSYAEETRFDWRDRQLVGVVGPIGSGKSSILDAIAFALYGRTPAIGSGTRGLINQRAAMAQVQLTFRVDGTAWQVIRAVKAKGASQHALYPFDEATWLPDQGQAITGDRAVTERVEQVLGLDFAGFQRSVLLAQNRFSEFLNATPGERDQVLKGVFGLDRIDAMQTLARERQRDAERDGEDLRRRLAEVAEARTRLDERRTQQQTLAARRVALDALRPRVEELDRAEREAQEAAARAAKRVTELDEMRQGLPPREQSQATLATFQQHSTDGEALAKARSRTEDAAAEARSARDAVLAELGGRERLDAAQAALLHAGHAHEALQREAQRAEQAQREQAAADAVATGAQTASKQAAHAVQVAAAALEQATAIEQAADATLHATERLDLALTLRSGVEAGDACPVCGRKIARLPAGDDTADVAEARTARDAARSERESAQRVETQAWTAAAAAERDVEATAQRLDAARHAVQQAEAERTNAARADTEAAQALRDLLGDGDAAERLAAMRARLDAAEAKATRADAEAEAARKAETAAGAALEAARRELTSLRLRLASVAARLDMEAPDDDTPEAVQALLATLRERWSAERAAADEARQAALASAQAASTTRREALTAGGVPEGQTYDDAMNAAGRDLAVLDALIAEDEQRIAAAADAEREGAAIEERRATYTRLYEDLRPSKFLSYLLDEDRAALAEIGSERFEHLSGGRYRFTDDGTFSIVDLTAAEAARPAATLSGGETFLASLSLALGLAEMVTRGSGRLDSFFLDEGFGSLDEEHLDLAMEGIERLVTESDDRLVVIVSHVPALRERIEDLVVLDRDAGTGNTIVRRGITASVRRD